MYDDTNGPNTRSSVISAVFLWNKEGSVEGTRPGRERRDVEGVALWSTTHTLTETPSGMRSIAGISEDSSQRCLFCFNSMKALGEMLTRTLLDLRWLYYKTINTQQ